MLLAVLGHFSTVEWITDKLPWLKLLPPTAWFIAAVGVLVVLLLRLERKMQQSIGVQKIEPATNDATQSDLGPEWFTFAVLGALLIDEAEKTNRVGFHLLVCNGNRTSIRLKQGPSEFGYGEDRVSPWITVEPAEIGPTREAHVAVWIQLAGSVGVEMSADLKAGTLKDIDLRRVVVMVSDDRGSGRLRLPGGIKFSRDNLWRLGTVSFVSCAAMATSTVGVGSHA